MDRTNYIKAEGRLFIFIWAISISIILCPFISNAATPPKISVKPTSVNLGSVKVGEVSAPRLLTIKNTGTSDLVINSITISGTNASEFGYSPTNGCPNPIPTNGSCPVTVTFTPTSPFGKKSAIISISSNDPKKPTVNTKLLGQAPPPKISVAPMSVNFTTVNIGNTSAPKTVTIKNTGISDLAINDISITGSNASEFNQTNSCTTTTIPKGDSCVINVTFTPEVPASKKIASIVVSCNDPKKPTINVKLSGSGSGGTGHLYSLADLEGTWEVNSLASGPGAPWWERGPLTVKPDGTITASFIESDGSPDKFSGALSISSDGVITGIGDANALFQMDSNKTVIVGTMTWTGYEAGTTDLAVLTKKATSYSTADLVGTWEMNGLGSPGPWWSRGAFTIGSDGAFYGMSNGSDGSANSMSGIFSITTEGIITATGSAPSFRCVMDSGKSIVVCTNTTNGGSTDMHILTKKAAGYSMADLVGTWENNSLASGPCSPWWERATMAVNEDGSLSISTVESTGATHNITGGIGTISITSDGVVLFHGGADVDLEGRMDSGKTIVVWTGTFGGGCYGGTQLKIFTKKAP